MAFLTSTLFLRTRLHPTDERNGSLYLGTLFFALIHMMFNGFSEMAITVARLPVFYKQRDNYFYPGWAFVAPNWILRLPYSFIESLIWSVIVYYSVGLDPSAGRYVKCHLVKFQDVYSLRDCFSLYMGQSHTLLRTCEWMILHV